MTVKIAVGIMLWNEENSIGSTIDSLFQQSLFTERKSGINSIEVMALANGCTDQSVPNAEAAFARNLTACPVSYVAGRVVELPKGRQPAWNYFVHHLTTTNTDYIFFMDADIALIDPDAMYNMVFGLEQNQRAHVATGNGIKHIERLKRRTCWQAMTLGMSRMARDARLFYVTGGLYCGRATFFRCLEFPRGFVCGDDGFIGIMAVTNLMTTSYEWDRVHYLRGPSFVFEAYLSPSRLFRQHRRRAIGAAVNTMIREYIAARQVHGEPDAGAILRSECESNPEWLNQYVADQVRQRGFWVVSINRASSRFTPLRRLSIWKKAVRFPLACAGAVWSLGIIIA